MKINLWQCFLINGLFNGLLKLRIFFNIFLVTYWCHLLQFFTLLFNNLLLGFLKNWEMKWTVIMNADYWPIVISYRNYREILAFVICINKLEFTLLIFSDMEHCKLSLSNWILWCQWFSDCADDKNLVLWPFYNFRLANEILFTEMVNKVISQ